MMSLSLKRVKSILLQKTNSQNDEVEPEIGFKLVYYPEGSQVGVKVISARNLPTCYGNLKPNGYFVKIKLYPCREKYETETVKDSRPNFNQEFKFPITGSPYSGTFLTLTVYANLEQPERKKVVSRSSFKEHIEAFIGDKDTTRTSFNRKSYDRVSIVNRRTVGAVTYRLEKDSFKQDLKNGKATPDIWRTLAPISSGIPNESKESKKGSLEVTMSYSESEDGRNDMVIVSLSKLRCSMQTMQDFEKLGGSLYIKMETLECDCVVGKWKSDLFVPVISMKIEPKTATMQSIVNNYNLDNIKIIIRLKCKDGVTKKMKLGEIIIDRNSYIWKKVIATPGETNTQMIDFE